MNVTLSIPPEVVRDAREYASARSTSLNQLIRDYLAGLTKQAERQRRAEEAMAFFESIEPTIPAGTRITREEMESR